MNLDLKMDSPPFGFEFLHNYSKVIEDKRKHPFIGSVEDSTSNEVMKEVKEVCRYCFQNVPRKRIKSHQKYCPKALKTCKFCGDIYHEEEVDDHILVCEVFETRKSGEPDHDSAVSTNVATDKVSSVFKKRKRPRISPSELSESDIKSVNAIQSLSHKRFKNNPSKRKNNFITVLDLESTASAKREISSEENIFKFTDHFVENKNSFSEAECLEFDSQFSENHQIKSKADHLEEEICYSFNSDNRKNKVLLNDIDLNEEINSSTTIPFIHSKFDHQCNSYPSHRGDILPSDILQTKPIHNENQILVVDLTVDDDDSVIQSNFSDQTSFTEIDSNHECSNSACILSELSGGKENLRSKKRVHRSSKKVEQCRCTIREEDCEVEACKEKGDRKSLSAIEALFGDFHCQICDVYVHSEITLQTHLVGKKHLKALRNLNAAEVARHSVSSSFNMLNSTADSDHSYYPTPAPGMIRIRLNKIATLQTVADGCRKHSITGLSYVTEIQMPDGIVYFCRLCASTCSPSSIMCHLVGYKHKLNFVKREYPRKYEQFYSKEKKVIKSEVERIIYNHDRIYERGYIKVERDVVEFPSKKGRCSDASSIFEKRLSSFSSSSSMVSGSQDQEKNEDLDLSMADYYCKICESHMGSKQIWEAHKRGKRHLKNKKKRPGEMPSKKKSFRCPGETAHIMNDLNHVSEPIVGLSYLVETQGRSGDQYKCLLCSGCYTSFDIIDHLTSEKHRKKYLETENRNGKKNSIDYIKSLVDLSSHSRQSLIAGECDEMQSIYGRGRVMVYKTKDIYSDLYGPDHQRDIF